MTQVIEPLKEGRRKEGKRDIKEGRRGARMPRKAQRKK
jgi:hypothetical protein